MRSTSQTTTSDRQTAAKWLSSDRARTLTFHETLKCTDSIPSVTSRRNKVFVLLRLTRLVLVCQGHIMGLLYTSGGKMICPTHPCLAGTLWSGTFCYSGDKSKSSSYKIPQLQLYRLCVWGHALCNGRRRCSKATYYAFAFH